MRKEMKMSDIGTRIGAAVLAALLGVVLFSGSARGAAPIHEFSMTPTTTQAGGHPSIETYFYVGNRNSQNIPAPSCDCQDTKALKVDFPTGVIGFPQRLPLCDESDFGGNRCPSDSQVGTVHIGLAAEVPSPGGIEGKENPSAEGLGGTLAVYNLTPHPGQAGLLGFFVPFVKSPVYIVLSARTGGDYGITARITSITHLAALAFSRFELWGVPAMSVHDSLRHPVGCEPFFESPPCYPGVASNSPEVPFLSNPTTCDVPLGGALEVSSYDNEITRATTSYPATTGCDQLDFNPSLFAQPTTERADSPSGLEADLEVPQNESPTVPSPSEIRGATITLPPGFSINSGAADGKTSCSDAEAAFGTEDESQCPEDSKIGTVTVANAILPGPLHGAIYLGEPQSGNRYRIFLTASGFATNVKLAGRIEPDPATSQITARFEDLPQTAFSDFNLHFFGAERGLLATPLRCGTYAVDSTFTPWDSLLPVQTSAQTFQLSSGPGGTACPVGPRPFSPGVRAGVPDTSAGRHTSFTVEVQREDGEQTLSDLTVKAPPGFAATLAGVSYCSDAALAAAASEEPVGRAQQANPSCPASSRIGTSSAAVGSGNHPAHLAGTVYLSGPYKGAPLSLAVVTPAVSGPYDLGNVVIRAAVRIDPVTAQVTTASDSLPQIYAGIPLRLRSVVVDLNRPGFVVNPTNCDAFAVGTDLSGDEGSESSTSSLFQIAGCAALPFAPKLSLRLSGGMKRTGHPAIDAVVTTKQGDANIARTVVTMPHSLFLDNAHIGTLCTRVQFTADACPARAVLGFARAETPLLDQPMEGPIYLRSSSHQLPDIVADLHGQIGQIVLDGRIDSVNGRLRASFESVPDVPVSRFELHLVGGSKGLVINSKDLCFHPQRALVRAVGQNGRPFSLESRLRLPCGSKDQRHRLHQRRLTGAGVTG